MMGEKISIGLSETVEGTDTKVIKEVGNMQSMTANERLMVLLLCGIGDRVDRLIGMVKELEKS